MCGVGDLACVRVLLAQRDRHCLNGGFKAEGELFLEVFVSALASLYLVGLSLKRQINLYRLVSRIAETRGEGASLSVVDQRDLGVLGAAVELDVDLPLDELELGFKIKGLSLGDVHRLREVGDEGATTQ